MWGKARGRRIVIDSRSIMRCSERQTLIFVVVYQNFLTSSSPLGSVNLEFRKRRELLDKLSDKQLVVFPHTVNFMFC